MKKLLLMVSVCMFFSSFAFAQNQLQIIPESKNDTSANVQRIWEAWGTVWQQYQKEASSLKDDLWGQMASGIFTWTTLLDYLVYLVKFLSQLGIFVGACFIIYAGYIYATSIFGNKTDTWTTAIKNAIIGTIVITFSYAIMKAITVAFLT